jgi:signal peptidase I
VLLVAVALAVAGALGSGAWLYATGWRLSTVATPSMSPSLPVGAAVVSRPLHAPARVGEVIVFRPPGDTHLYVHKVVAVLPGPSYRTKGDNDALPDPWTVPAGDVVGDVVASVPDLGWLVLGAPLIGAAILGAAVLGVLLPRWRRWLVLDALSAGLLLVSLRLHPFVRWQVVTTSASKGATRAWLFDTGVLPIRVRTVRGDVVIAPGHAAVIVGHGSRSPLLGVSPDLGHAGWLVVGTVSAVPVAVALLAAWLGPVISARRARARARAATPAPSSSRYRPQPAVRLVRQVAPVAPCSCPPGPCWFDGACRWPSAGELAAGIRWYLPPVVPADAPARRGEVKGVSTMPQAAANLMPEVDSSRPSWPMTYAS